jgi:hypothetical protein
MLTSIVKQSDNEANFKYKLGQIGEAELQHKISVATGILLLRVLIPIGDLSQWQDLHFGSISKNTVTSQGKGLQIEVNKSASPLIYALPAVSLVTGFNVKAQLHGDPKFETTAWSEDYPLRIGLVAQGEKTLSGPKKFFAPSWVKQLFSLAKDGQGVDKIYFFNWAPGFQKVGDRRNHPKSEFIIEEIFSTTADSKLDLRFELSKPLPVLALWLSVDGDDLKKEYLLRIEHLELETKQ